MIARFPIAISREVRRFLFHPHKVALKNRYKLCTIAQLTFLSFLAVCTLLRRVLCEP